MIVEKPWGKVTTYALNQTSSVRIITIEPGQETSEHYHQLRDEMWIVLDEGLRIQIGNRQVEARVGEEFVVVLRGTASNLERGHEARTRARDRPRVHDRGRRVPPAGRLRPDARTRMVGRTA